MVTQVGDERVYRGQSVTPPFQGSGGPASTK